MPELDRRQFLKVVGISAGAAAAAACQDPVEKVIPYLIQPEEIIPGIPTYYASACRECPNACPTRVKTREGRPIKVDVNSDAAGAPDALCVRGQSSLHRTYDATRFRGPMRREGDRLVPATWEEALDRVANLLAPVARSGKVTFLTSGSTGTLDGLIDEFLSGTGSGERLRFELYAHEALRAANRQVFGVDAVPHFDVAASDFVVSFGCDFLETWLNAPQNQSGYAESRRAGKGYAVYVGPRLSLTGGNADEWIAPRPGSEVFVALAMAHELSRGSSQPVAALLAPFSPASVAERTGVPAASIEAIVSRMRRARAPLALPPGNELQGTNSAQFAAAVQVLNWVSGAVGKTVRFGPDHATAGLARFRDLKELAARMRGGEVQALLVHDVNPLYAMPSAFGLADALAQVPLIVSFASAPDEMTSRAHWVLPDHTPFESWGDAEPVAAIRRLQQPTIRPIFDTRAVGDVLLDLGRRMGADLGKGDFFDRLASRWGGPAALHATLGTGGEGRPAPDQAVTLAASVAKLKFEPAQLGGEGDLVLLAYPSLHFYDGRSARLDDLQQIPNPVTKATWGSYAELHPRTAEKLGLARGDVVRIRSEAAEIELPVLPHPAVRPGVVAIEVGQGHQPLEPDAELPFDNVDQRNRKGVRGVNVLSLLPGRLDPASGGLAWLSARVRIEPTGEHFRPVVTQPTFDQAGRGLAQATTLAALEGREDPPEDAPELESLEYDPAEDPATGDGPYRWGMIVDVDACTGCNACIAACGQENNTPVTGPDLTRVGREMAWIRTERYVRGEGTDLEVQILPAMCQHCASAPCENVCPVLATYHTEDGLNAMTYNRCIGTRYCSNNCPYKVRRFNYLPYDFYVRTPEELGLNPDVTVRSKGVMEKCTLCVQRILPAKYRARSENRLVADGEVAPACVEGCPSQALTFGNWKDPKSRLVELARGPRTYVMLANLNTRPGVQYLKSIRRNPARGGGPEGSGSAHHG
ncbi:MAG: molybdopterin-dependent oxidoreductase [Myxococcota bacterium]